MNHHSSGPWHAWLQNEQHKPSGAVIPTERKTQSQDQGNTESHLPDMREKEKSNKVITFKEIQQTTQDEGFREC